MRKPPLVFKFNRGSDGDGFGRAGCRRVDG
jgi:hypothetical protein